MISNHISFGNKMTDYLNKTNTNDKIKANNYYSHDKMIKNWFENVPQLFNKKQKEKFIEVLELDLLSSFPDAVSKLYKCPNGHYYFELYDKVKNIRFNTTFNLEK
jgi:hypothetical protein